MDIRKSVYFLAVLFITSLTCTFSNAAGTVVPKSTPPDWVIALPKPYVMAEPIYAQITLNGYPIGVTAGSKLSAWHGTMITGLSDRVTGPFGAYFCMTVYSNSASVPNMTLKLYDAATDTVYNINETFDFAVNAVIGSFFSPKRFTAAAPVGAVPDLTVTSTVANPTAVNAGETTDVTVSVQNTGSAASEATTVNIFVSDNNAVDWDTLAPDESFSLASLIAGGTDSDTKAVAIPATDGTYYIRANVVTVADEIDTLNNWGEIKTVTVATTYTVTFLGGDNGSLTSVNAVQTVASGGSAVEPIVTANTGWIFTGWDVPFTNVTSDITVTAQYSVQTFTVIFDAGFNGLITAGTAIQTVNYGTSAVEPTVTANTGWVFTGWDKMFDNIASYLVVTALYEYWIGDGTTNNPYQIRTRQHLEAMNSNLSANYILMNDIDLEVAIYTQAVIAPDTDAELSGFQGTVFTGSFNGNGFKINNLTIFADGKDYIGMFGFADTNAVISNICLTGGRICGMGDYIGGLTGFNAGVITSSCTTVDVEVGRLLFCPGPPVSVIGSFCTGGLVGYNSGKIINCYTKSYVSGYEIVGGLVGSNSINGTAINSYATGLIEGSDYVGGLVGNSNYPDSIINCFWDTETSWQATSYGGTGKTTAEMQDINTFLSADWDCELVWMMSDPASEFEGYPILRSQQMFTVTFVAGDKGIISSGQAVQDIPYGNPATAPGITPNTGWEFSGWDMAFNNVMSNLTVTAQYTHQTFTVIFTAGAYGAITGGDSEQTIAYGGAATAPTITANAGWEFIGWNVDSSSVTSNLTVTALYRSAGMGLEGNGTAGNPYQISTVEDLYAVNRDLAAHYILLNDIDLTGITFLWAVIAPDTMTSSGFQGSFDGNGFTIKNLTISARTNICIDIGLFGYVAAGSIISNLGVYSGDVNGYYFVGGLVGRSYGTITNCHAAGSVTGTGDYCYVGGLVGCSYGTITNCYATGAVGGEGVEVGGLVGFGSGTIINCYAASSVTGTGDYCYVGGLAGHIGHNSTITNCYATANVSGSDVVGGMVGYMGDWGAITNCYATGAVSGTGGVGGLVGFGSGTITNCYATGAVSGDGDCVGGLVGYNESPDDITNCFWDTQTSGCLTSAGGAGKTTAQMKNIDTFLADGWDFVNEADNGLMDLWQCLDGEYPRLYWQADKGDLDYDGTVDDDDLAILIWQWLSLPQEDERLVADINEDGMVDIQDFAILASHWRGSPDITWVSINDHGVSGHEGFTGQMSKYETTNAQYCQFLNAAKASGAITVSGDYVVGNAGACSGQNYYNLAGSGYTGSGYTGYGATNGGAARINWTGSSFTIDPGFENHPVTYVSWYGATAFAVYYGWQLPTEWEWQAVADYDGSYTYGCGTTINNSIANYPFSTHPDGTTEVGTFGAYGYGLADMAGNVWEWTGSLHDPAYSYRVFRGGSWFSFGGNNCDVSLRGYGHPSLTMSSYNGFRVCRGSQISYANIPDVTGMAESDAEYGITKAGFVLGTISEQFSETVPAGCIITQTPAAGTNVPIGTAVNLVVSKGEEHIVEITWVSISDPGVNGHEGFTGDMSKYETTNAQYCQYLNSALSAGLIVVYNNTVYAASDTIHSQPYCDTYISSSYSQIVYSGDIFSVRTRDGFSMDNHPMVMVSWYGATAFCNYYGYRLPTEWEWQAVADYNGSYTYGCGTTISQSKANYYLGNSVYCNPLGLTSYPYTSPVGYYGTFGYDLADMAGNVWEWTNSLYDPAYSYRVLRGGCWDFIDIYCTVLYRSQYYQKDMNRVLGFRVCRSQPQPQPQPQSNITWVSISDPGVSGHEGFTGDMSKYEATNSQYCQYLNAALASGDITVSDNYVVGDSGAYNGCNYYRLDGPGFTYDGATNGGKSRIIYANGEFAVESGFENHPVTYVSWYGATAFAAYYDWRLPTEWEWQAVADYDGSYTYGCGTSINNSIANYLNSTHPYGTTPVGQYGTFGYGVADMAGNIWEWTSTVSVNYRVMRGGGWYYPDGYCTVSYRLNSSPSSVYYDTGFRVCR